MVDDFGGKTMKLKDGHGPSGGDSRRRVLALAGWADFTLKTLEREKWTTETLGKISSSAQAWGLAKLDSDGKFIGIDRRDRTRDDALDLIAD
jgi:hypothetical protein